MKETERKEETGKFKKTETRCLVVDKILASGTEEEGTPACRVDACARPA